MSTLWQRACLFACLITVWSVPVEGQASADPILVQVRNALRHSGLGQLQTCLQRKAGFTRGQTQQLKTALARGKIKLAQFQMTGFGVGGYCGEHFMSSSARSQLFQRVSQRIKGYFSCLHKRKMLCQGDRASIQCWRLGIEFLFQAFSDGTPFQSKMPRPFVCQSPAYSFDEKAPANQKAPSARCAYAKKIASWKGDEQQLLGFLRGCTLELLFRRYWKGPFRFRQVVLLRKKVGAQHRGGRVLMNLRFFKLPLLRLTHQVGVKPAPFVPWFRPLDIYTRQLSAPLYPRTFRPNRCKRTCCP